MTRGNIPLVYKFQRIAYSNSNYEFQKPYYTITNIQFLFTDRPQSGYRRFDRFNVGEELADGAFHPSMQRVGR